VNGGSDVGGDEIRFEEGSFEAEASDFISEAAGGWVAEVGVGSGGGAAPLDELIVFERRFLLGWPFE